MNQTMLLFLATILGTASARAEFIPVTCKLATVEHSLSAVAVQLNNCDSPINGSNKIALFEKSNWLRLTDGRESGIRIEHDSYHDGGKILRLLSNAQVGDTIEVETFASGNTGYPGGDSGGIFLHSIGLSNGERILLSAVFNYRPSQVRVFMFKARESERVAD